MPGPLLERLPSHSDEKPIDIWRVPIQLLADGPLSDANSVALIPVGSIEPAELNAFSANLGQALGPQKELLISSDLLTTRACSTQLLITAPGAAKHETIRQLSEQLTLQGRPVVGWVLLNSSLKA